MRLWKLFGGIAVAATVLLSGAFAGPAMAAGQGQGPIGLGPPGQPGVLGPTAPGKAFPLLTATGSISPLNRASPGTLFRAGLLQHPVAGQFNPSEFFIQPKCISAC